MKIKTKKLPNPNQVNVNKELMAMSKSELIENILELRRKLWARVENGEDGLVNLMMGVEKRHQELIGVIRQFNLSLSAHSWERYRFGKEVARIINTLVKGGKIIPTARLNKLLKGLQSVEPVK